MSKSRKVFLNLLAVLIGFGILAALFFLYEWGAKQYEAHSPSHKLWETSSGEYYIDHSYLGRLLTPNNKIRINRFLGEKKILSYTFTTDNWSRRVTPEIPALKPPPHQYAIFFGGSYVFGEGVENDKTLPYYLQKEMPQFKSYNYGDRGNGTQHMLAFLESENLKEQVTESSGLVIYAWPTDHIFRTIGAPQIIEWAKKFPYYTLSKDGLPKYKGFFHTARKELTDKYLKLSESALAKNIGLKNIYKLTEKDYQLQCALVKESKRLVEKQLPKARFITVALPFWFKPKLYKKQKTCLDQANIPVINLEKVFSGYQRNQVQIKDDGHGTALGNELLAKELARQLKTGQP